MTFWPEKTVGGGKVYGGIGGKRGGGEGKKPNNVRRPDYNVIK